MEYKSTPKAFKDFIEGYIWADIEQELNCWIEDIREQLETTSEIENVLRLQGNLQLCKNASDSGCPNTVLGR